MTEATPTRPWFASFTVLRVIARLKRNPPERKFTPDRWSRNSHDGRRDYVGADVERLRKMSDAAARNTPHEQWAGLFEISADEILAALFGDPNGLDWAHPKRAARRTALAAEIDALLANPSDLAA